MWIMAMWIKAWRAATRLRAAPLVMLALALACVGTALAAYTCVDRARWQARDDAVARQLKACRSQCNKADASQRKGCMAQCRAAYGSGTGGSDSGGASKKPKRTKKPREDDDEDRLDQPDQPDERRGGKGGGRVKANFHYYAEGGSDGSPIGSTACADRAGAMKSKLNKYHWVAINPGAFGLSNNGDVFRQQACGKCLDVEGMKLLVVDMKGGEGIDVSHHAWQAGIGKYSKDGGNAMVNARLGSC